MINDNVFNIKSEKVKRKPKFYGFSASLFLRWKVRSVNCYYWNSLREELYGSLSQWLDIWDERGGERVWNLSNTYVPLFLLAPSSSFKSWSQVWRRLYNDERIRRQLKCQHMASIVRQTSRRMLIFVSNLHYLKFLLTYS